VKGASLALLLAAAALLVAGCGRQSYGSKVSKLCENFAKRERQIATPSDPQALAARGDKIVKAYDEEILQPLLRIQPPEQDAAAARRLRGIAQQQRDTLQALADAGKRGDVQQVRRLAVRNAQLNAQAGDVARQIKADSCT
jgi:hypothetical protein